MADQFLDLERRTGVKGGDIDEFVDKVDSVQKAIRALAEGREVDVSLPEELAHVLDTPQQRAEREARDKQRKEEYEKRERERKEAQAREEHERWWRGARSSKDMNEDDVDGEEKGEEDEQKGRNLERYTTDYSKWEQWSPDDPVTKAEQEEQQQLIDKKKNEAFEAANPEFCGQFKEDMEARNKSLAATRDKANTARLKGNKLYSKGDCASAIDMYMESLKAQPYDVRTLANIAQAHIRLERWPEGMEFCNRVLFLEPTHTKALSRRAKIRAQAKHFEHALTDVRLALVRDPSNSELVEQERNYSKELEEARIEQRTLAINAVREVPTASNIQNWQDLEGLAENGLRTWIDQLVQKLTSWSDGHGNGAELPSMRDTLVATAAATSAIEASTELRAYFRVSNGIPVLAEWLIASNNNEFEAGPWQAMLDLLRASIHTERSSKLQLVNIPLLELVETTATSVLLKEATLRLAAIRFLVECTSDDCGELRGKIAANFEFLNRVLLSCHSNSSVYSSEASRLFSNVFKHQASKAQGPRNAAAVHALEYGGIKTIIERLGAEIGNNSSTDRATWLQACKGWCDLAAEVSMRADLHTFLFSPEQESSADVITPLAVLLRTVNVDDDCKCSILAALINLSAANSATYRNLILASIAPRYVTTVLLAGSVERACWSSHLKGRSAILFSRLIPEITHDMKADATCERVVALLTESCTDGAVANIDERHALIRILASFSHPSPKFFAQARQHNLSTVLLRLLPEPMKEGGEWTATSVCLPPRSKLYPQAIGNICKILIALVDDDVLASAVVSTEGIAKLICCLSNQTNLSTRKNIAIVLAKNMKRPGVREIVQSFRGMQMLMEIQGQLLI